MMFSFMCVIKQLLLPKIITALGFCLFTDMLLHLLLSLFPLFSPLFHNCCLSDISPSIWKPCSLLKHSLPRFGSSVVKLRHLCCQPAQQKSKRSLTKQKQCFLDLVYICYPKSAKDCRAHQQQPMCHMVGD